MNPTQKIVLANTPCLNPSPSPLEILDPNPSSRPFLIFPWLANNQSPEPE